MLPYQSVTKLIWTCCSFCCSSAGAETVGAGAVAGCWVFAVSVVAESTGYWGVVTGVTGVVTSLLVSVATTGATSSPVVGVAVDKAGLAVAGTVNSLWVGAVASWLVVTVSVG